MLVWHKFKLTILRNYRDIVFTVTSMLIIATFLVVVISLEKILEQSAQNERLLKPLACILLIKPEIRTEQDIRNCIRDNGGNLNFEFKPPQDSPNNPKKAKNGDSKYQTLDVAISPPKKQGEPYRVVAVPNKVAPKPVQETKQKKPREPVSLVFEKIYRVSPTSGLREWKYANIDMNWVISNVQ